MKRPVEFWAAVLIAAVVVYMIHDAYGDAHQAQEVVHIEPIDLDDIPDHTFEPAGVYTEWQSSVQPSS